ncbi:MAG: SUF system Fe-S cluster assembly protein [Legionellales bacterium]|nr:SUF system Fe-S cluster assembly protein [Legionellales bacterium]
MSETPIEPIFNDNLPSLREQVVEAIKTIFDPEIPVNIYDLGLIYKIEIADNNKVFIDMTLTSPGCPVAQSLPLSVSDTVREVPGVTDVQLELVWDPPWSTDMMSEVAKLQLGMF